MDVNSSASSLKSGESRGRSESRQSDGTPTRERSRSSCRTDVFLPKSSHIHVRRQESTPSNPDKITRFASPTRTDYSRHEIVVPRVQQSYHTSLSAVVPPHRLIADKENHDGSSDGSGILNTSRDSEKGSYYSEKLDDNYWHNKRNTRPYASLPVTKGHILSARVQAMDRYCNKLINDHCEEQERFCQDMYDIATGKPPRVSQNSLETSSNHSSPLKSLSPHKNHPGYPVDCSTPKHTSTVSVNSETPAGTCHSDSGGEIALHNGAIVADAKPRKSGARITRSASDRSHCQQNGGTKEHVSKRTVYQPYHHEKKVTYYELVEKFGDIDDDPEARVAMKEMGMLQGSEVESEVQSMPSTPRSVTKSEARSQDDQSSTSSKKSLAVTITNFIKKMSPRLHRRSSKESRSSERSKEDDGDTTSGASSLSGSPAKPSRTRSPLSSPIRRLMGQSGKRSREQSPVSAERQDRENKEKTTEAQQTDKSGQKQSFDNNTKLLLKSIEDNSNTEKNVYQNFKGRQAKSCSDSDQKQPVRVKKTSDASDAPTVTVSEVTSAESPKPQVMRSPPPQSLNIRSISRLSKKGMMSTVSSDSIGECSLDVTMTGSEPSIASGNGHHSGSISKRTLLSQDNIGAPLGQKTRHQSSSESEITNIAAQNERDTSGKVQSYVHLSCALSGYNKYNSYAEDKQKLVPNEKSQNHSEPSSPNLNTPSSGDRLELNGHAVRDSVAGDDDVFVTLPNSTDSDHRTDSHAGDVVSHDAMPKSCEARRSRPSSSGDKHGAKNVVISTEPRRIPEPEVDKTVGKDGDYFLNVIRQEKEAILALCAKAVEDLKTLENNPGVSEEACGKLRAFIGKANLLVSQKFEQFRGLCHQNLTQDPNESLHTTCEDLAGFWDLISLQVEELHSVFQDIEEMKNNGWKEVVKEVTVKRTLSTSSQKSNEGSTETKGGARPKAPRVSAPTKAAKGKSSAEKAREEARKRLMEAKKAARRKRMNSQSNDEVEIFIAEPSGGGQTN